MKDPFGIAKIINPNVDDLIEKKKLKEHDDVRSGKIMIIPKRCRHISTITLSNGDIECMDCHLMWIIKEHRHLYPHRYELEEKED